MSELGISELKLARSLAKNAAIQQLVKHKVGVYRIELEATIIFTSTGIKACVNQPFKHYRAKLSLIQHSLEEALRTAKYIGFTTKQTHPKPHVRGYYYFETEIGGEPAYFNIQLTVQDELILFSITDRVNL